MNNIPIVPLGSAAKEKQTELLKTYNDWTKKLFDISATMSYAVIGANWAVFQSTHELLASPFAIASLVTVLAGLAFEVLGTWIVAESSRLRFKYSEADHERWTNEFRENDGKDVEWPHNEGAMKLATFMRVVKAFAPILAGVLFIVALAQYSPQFYNSNGPLLSPKTCCHVSAVYHCTCH